MISPNTRKLGKLAPRHDPRTLKLYRYLRPDLPTPPDTVDWSSGITYDMLGNDSVGDCAIAGPDHLIQTWTGQTTTECSITTDQAIADYSTVTGYVPGDESTDNGCVLLDVLKFWKSTGLAGGRQITGYVSVASNHTELATWLFGGLLIGLQLPESAMDQNAQNQIWTPVNGSPIAGGHCVCIVGYDPAGLTCITWGQRQKMDWDFYDQYCDESWGCLSCDWANGTKQAPSGFDFAALQNDLQSIT